jgi:branched-chain amino acid transport system permease protein
MDYLLLIMTLAVTYAALATALDLVVGRAGMLSLAHGALYGIGAYTTALLNVHCDTSFLMSATLGMVIATGVSFAVSVPCLRLRGDYFAIATFGFQMVFYHVVNNWAEVTNGAMGVSVEPAACAVRSWARPSSF